MTRDGRDATTQQTRGGNGFPYPSRDECPDRDKHTPRPDGYIAFTDWAREKSKTHRQERCPTCFYWVIWKPKRKRAKA